MPGTTLSVRVVRVVDGDTIRVEIPNGEESLRILSLDTEESRAGGSKPKTPFGLKAKAEAERLFTAGDTVTLEFPGSEPLDECLRIHRGKFDRLLVYVFTADGDDFQEHMIQSGFSPYFIKYGNAVDPDKHRRYQAAEREAQIADRGVWNQIAVNQAELRNYAALGVWWQLRAKVIEEYRQFRATHGTEVLETRLDYDKIATLAAAGANARLILELSEITRVGGRHGLIRVGSQDRPFDIFIPRIDEPDGEQIVTLLTSRYIPGDLEHPRVSYAYLQGSLGTFRDKPQIVITNLNQISDSP